MLSIVSFCNHSIGDWHVVEIDIWGPGDIASGAAFHVMTTQKNPAPIGQVTGKATYASFLSSMLGRFQSNINPVLYLVSFIRSWCNVMFLCPFQLHMEKGLVSICVELITIAH